MFTPLDVGLLREFDEHCVALLRPTLQVVKEPNRWGSFGISGSAEVAADAVFCFIQHIFGAMVLVLIETKDGNDIWSIQQRNARCNLETVRQKNDAERQSGCQNGSQHIDKIAACDGFALAVFRGAVLQLREHGHQIEPREEADQNNAVAQDSLGLDEAGRETDQDDHAGPTYWD